MSIPIRVQLERDQALIDVSAIVNEYGEDIVVYIRGESDVTRDKYKSLKRVSFATTTPVQYSLKAYPVEHSPNRMMMEKAGIREQCECIAWFATKDLTDNSLSFDFIENEKVTIIIDGNDYGVSEKGKAVLYADAHLYTTFGLFKKTGV